MMDTLHASVFALAALLIYALYEVWRMDRLRYHARNAAVEVQLKLSLADAETKVLEEDIAFKDMQLKIAFSNIAEYEERINALDSLARARGDEGDALAIKNEYLTEALGEIIWEYADLVGEAGKYGDTPDALDLAVEKGVRVMAGDAP